MSPRRLSDLPGDGVLSPPWRDPEDSVPRRLPPILTCPGCGGRHHILNPCECEEKK